MIFDWKLELLGTLHSVGQNLKDCPDKQVAEVGATSHCLAHCHAPLPSTFGRASRDVMSELVAML